jgi:hypothetical protein
MAGPRVLDERVAERRVGLVAHGDRGDQIAVALHRLRGLELDDVTAIGQAPEDDAHVGHQRFQTRRAVHGQRLAAFAQRKGLEHPRQPQPVVGVVVRDEHAVEIEQADGSQQLALRAFAAVE